MSNKLGIVSSWEHLEDHLMSLLMYSLHGSVLTRVNSANPSQFRPWSVISLGFARGGLSPLRLSIILCVHRAINLPRQKYCIALVYKSKASLFCLYIPLRLET